MLHYLRPRGWRSWNAFDCMSNDTIITQAHMRAQMVAAVDKSRTVKGKPTSLAELVSGRADWPLINPKKMPGGKKAKKYYEPLDDRFTATGIFSMVATSLSYLTKSSAALSSTISSAFLGSGNFCLPSWDCSSCSSLSSASPSSRGAALPAHASL